MDHLAAPKAIPEEGIPEAAVEDSAVKAAVLEDPEDRADRGVEENASISARKRCADSASSTWISSITNEPKCSSLLCRNAAKFCRAA